MSAGTVRPDVTAIVLAGGRSTRFGSDKLGEDVDGMTVLHRAIAAVASVADGVIVVGATPRVPPAIDQGTVRAVADAEPGGGPLQALAGALAETTTLTALVVAGDMPSLVPSVLELLLEVLNADPEVDAAVLADPRDPTRQQPLPAALRVAPARLAATTAVEAGDRSLVRLLGRLALAELPAERWQPLDPDARTLVDIDVPDDLERLRHGASDRRKR